MLRLIIKENLSILTARIIFKHAAPQWYKNGSLLYQPFHGHSHLKPLTWKKYIADVFSLWNVNKEENNTFIEQANSYHPTIKFTSIRAKDSRRNPFLTCANRQKLYNTHTSPPATLQASGKAISKAKKNKTLLNSNADYTTEGQITF